MVINNNNNVRERTGGHISSVHVSGKCNPFAHPDNAEIERGALFERMTIPTLVWLLVYDDKDQVIDEQLLDGNNAAITMLRKAGLRSFRGRHISKMSPEDHTNVIPLVRQLKNSGGPLVAERYVALTNKDYLTSTCFVDKDVIVTTYLDLTDHRLHNAASEDGTERFQLLFDHVSDSVWMVDGRGEILATNDAALKRLEFEHDELTGTKWIELVAPVERPAMEVLFDNLDEWGNRMMRTVIRTKEGQQVPIEVKCLASVFERRPTYLLIANCRDRSITRSARHENGRYQEIVEALADVVWEIDFDGIIRFVNTASMKKYGYAPNELEGLSIGDIYSYRSDVMAEQLHRCLRELRPFDQIERQVVRKDGEAAFVVSNGRPMFDSQGLFIGYSGMDRDITRLRKEYDLLLERDLLLRDAIDHLPMGVYVITLQPWEVKMANHRFCQLLGIENMETRIGKREAGVIEIIKAIAENVVDKNGFTLAWLSLSKSEKCEIINGNIELENGMVVEFSNVPLFNKADALVGRIFMVKERTGDVHGPNM